MPILLPLILAALIGYICGAVPFGFLYVRLFKGEDLRTIGSGRTGGTNSMRAGGAAVGVLTAMSDVFKGACAVWGTQAALTLFGLDLTAAQLPWIIGTAGVASVIGHNWSIFIGFKGGAGTGPNVGWSSVLWWPMFPIAWCVMLAMLAVTGMASVASMTMGLVIPVAFLLLRFGGGDISIVYILAGLVTFLIVVWALRPNIKRILNGTERLVGPRAWRRRRREMAAQGEGGT